MLQSFEKFVFIDAHLADADGRVIWPVPEKNGNSFLEIFRCRNVLTVAMLSCRYGFRSPHGPQTTDGDIYLFLATGGEGTTDGDGINTITALLNGHDNSWLVEFVAQLLGPRL